MLKNGELLTYEIENSLVWDDQWFEGLTEFSTGDFGFFEEINVGDTLMLEVSSINKVYYDFINNIKLEVGSRDPFGFIGGAANIKGNIEPGGLGFFLCTAINRPSVIVQ